MNFKKYIVISFSGEKKNEQILQTTHEWVNDYDDKGKLDIEQHSLKARI